MKTIAIVGFPLSGSKALSQDVAARTGFDLVDSATVRECLESSSQSAIALIRRETATGELLTEAETARLWCAAVEGAGDCLVAHFPRSVEVLREFEELTGRRVHVIRLDVGLETLEERHRALTGEPIEKLHPGAIDRVHRAIDEICDFAASSGGSTRIDGGQEAGAILESVLPLL